jgi:CBS domain-containing protein
VPVQTLMDPRPATARPDLHLDEFVYEDVVRRGRRALPVCDGGRLVGLISITDARKVPRDAWPTVAVDRVMTPAPLKTVSAQTSLETALALLAEGDLHQLPVVDAAGQLVGLLSRSDILRYLRYRDLAGSPPSDSAPGAGSPESSHAGRGGADSGP